MQIGEVAERTGLSLRTIRYYEEAGLVTPSARSQGGFRLYTEPDVARLRLAKRMKPLGFQLDEMRELLALLYPATAGAAKSRKPSKEQRERLRGFTDTAERRCAELSAKLEEAEGFAEMLRERLAQQAPRSTRVG
ncbi:MerR family transcriptional regulator [Qaidamihabitans albus]|uniref:MerR family transcriptional regulator n=1 Tax=Qaidamihabitans albus TaxID=2795733 RepID=UPI0018F14903|nr:MerR family transcriptional regulator [Qaidamihabitans albus]